jgi:MoaA/NifB/PqqE/SkfB family radical SAM enzyme
VTPSPGRYLQRLLDVLPVRSTPAGWRWNRALVNRALSRLDRLVLAGRAPGDELHANAKPDAFQIGINNTCNLRCRMCRQGELKRKGYDGVMSVATFRDVVDQLEGVRRLSLLGIGEPLLHPALPELIAHAVERGRELGWIVSTTTNGQLLSGRRAEQLARSGIHEVRVSVDAVDAPTYESIRRGGQLDRLVENVRQFRRQFGGTMALNSIVCTENFHGLERVIPFAHDLGFQAVQLLDVLPWTGSDLGVAEKTTTRIPAAERRRFLTAARESARRHGIDLTVDVERQVDVCHAPWGQGQGYVSFNGQLTPCCAWNDLEVGDVTGGRFQAVYNGARMRELRRMMLEGPGGTAPRFCVERCILRPRARVSDLGASA